MSAMPTLRHDPEFVRIVCNSILRAKQLLTVTAEKEQVQLPSYAHRLNDDARLLAAAVRLITDLTGVAP